MIQFCFPDTDSSSSLITSYSHFPSPSPSLPLQRFQALSTINQSLLTTKNSPIIANHSRHQSVDIEEHVDGVRSSSYVSDCPQTLSRASSCKSLPTDNQSWVSDEASSSGAFNDYSSCESQVTYLLFALACCQISYIAYCLLVKYFWGEIFTYFVKPPPLRKFVQCVVLRIMFKFGKL